MLKNGIFEFVRFEQNILIVQNEQTELKLNVKNEKMQKYVKGLIDVSKKVDILYFNDDLIQISENYKNMEDYLFVRDYINKNYSDQLKTNIKNEGVSISGELSNYGYSITNLKTDLDPYEQEQSMFNNISVTENGARSLVIPTTANRLYTNEEKNIIKVSMLLCQGRKANIIFDKRDSKIISVMDGTSYDLAAQDLKIIKKNPQDYKKSRDAYMQSISSLDRVEEVNAKQISKRSQSI